MKIQTKKTFAKTLLIAGLCFTATANAGVKLDAINAAVEAKEAQLAEQQGLVLSAQESDNLKMTLIINQVLADAPTAKGASIKALANAAFATYQIEGITAQRDFLIQLAAQAQQKGTGSSGTGPDYP